MPKTGKCNTSMQIGHQSNWRPTLNGGNRRNADAEISKVQSKCHPKLVLHVSCLPLLFFLCTYTTTIRSTVPLIDDDCLHIASLHTPDEIAGLALRAPDLLSWCECVCVCANLQATSLYTLYSVLVTKACLLKQINVPLFILVRSLGSRLGFVKNTHQYIYQYSP